MSRARLDKPAPPAGWTGRTVVVLAGGPRHRWCYFLEDVEKLQVDERKAGRPWHYRATTQLVEHREYAAPCTVWRWSPAAPR